MSSFCARSPNVTARRARAHDSALPFYYYSIIQCTVQYAAGENKKEGTDPLTLVSVFILYTYCHKYRINFSIIEGGPGGASPRHHLLQICKHSLTVVHHTFTSPCIQSFHTLPQVPNLLLR